MEQRRAISAAVRGAVTMINKPVAPFSHNGAARLGAWHDGGVSRQ